MAVATVCAWCPLCGDSHVIGEVDYNETSSEPNDTAVIRLDRNEIKTHLVAHTHGRVPSIA